jgi:hypothetical protein
MKMSDYQPDPPEPVRVFLYGDNVASVNGEIMLSGFGSNPVRTIARRMLRMGYAADQVLDLNRGGESIERVLLRDAAQGEL